MRFEIEVAAPDLTKKDFRSQQKTECLTSLSLQKREEEAVIKTMADYVSAGKLHDIVAVLPSDMKSYFLEWMHTP